MSIYDRVQNAAFHLNRDAHEHQGGARRRGRQRFSPCPKAQALCAKPPTVTRCPDTGRETRCHFA